MQPAMTNRQQRKTSATLRADMPVPVINTITQPTVMTHTPVMPCTDNMPPQSLHKLGLPTALGMVQTMAAMVPPQCRCTRLHRQMCRQIHRQPNRQELTHTPVTQHLRRSPRQQPTRRMPQVRPP